MSKGIKIKRHAICIAPLTLTLSLREREFMQ